MAQVFDGITVLDFTRGMPGGIATMVMSDFGAEVIKVEAPSDEKFRKSPGAIQWNRGKKSVILDLKTPQGREKAHKLARLSDVVIESFRPGVTRRLGIDYANLAADHPELVYASLTGFGAGGPYANYKGYDAVVAAKTHQSQFRFSCLACSAKNDKYEGTKTTKLPQCPTAPMRPAVRPTPRVPNNRDRGLEAWHNTRTEKSSVGTSV